MSNPYDASKGGAKAILKKIVISRPDKTGPYKGTKPVVKYE